ncbi:unnamed protein product [Didymodactylos carnosus]|uniref:Uncharacterized protein n=1 Tax=Didymodactylos carnosus TaxID=1234261 RepID=A0A816ENS2_9BILA|nr:unnamed protein product [Didymodactylos carnosus]CAF1652057.1 unnamed protein product [Didymodactylos carnosus]CAF3856133.1 unnamed protein product [Didymodactylos carnosus]CAF4582250.1 unnamed protein product [Didymodactylos carnosus]
MTKSLIEANQMVMKKMIDYIGKIEPRQKIPNNAKKFILEVLRNSNHVMKKFHVDNALLKGVVQIDTTFTGTNHDRRNWRPNVQINADIPNAKHGQPHHYGGEVNLTGMDSRNILFKEHVEIPEAIFQAGRPTHPKLRLEINPQTSKGNATFGEISKVQWEGRWKTLPQKGFQTFK